MVAFALAIETCKLKNRMERKGRNIARSAGNLGGSFGGGSGGRSAFRGGSSGSSQSFAQSSITAPPSGRGTTQPASSVATTFVVPPPARGPPIPVGHGETRGYAQSSGGSSCFYSMRGRQSLETFPGVVTSILTVQSHDVYALIDPDSTLSYVTPYVVMEFGIETEHLHEPFFISTLVGESILATRVYRDFVVMVQGRDTMDDLIKLGMVDFDTLMGMNWLYSCFSKLDCRTRTVRFEFPYEPIIEWKGDDVVPKDSRQKDFTLRIREQGHAFTERRELKHRNHVRRTHSRRSDARGKEYLYVHRDRITFI
uniref:Uncharacterized protein LOC104249607 n=1 Tax=Nicotiana sylvestris TaxID=4096 RepID=A0A1U7YJV1_NICSY|nr:PREDICTED: uncharacterized protein LOC104249607 [Nicotiana sylvestris]